MEELLKENELPQQPLPEDDEIPAEPTSGAEDAPVSEASAPVGDESPSSEASSPDGNESPVSEVSAPEETPEEEDFEKAEAAVSRRIRRRNKGIFRFCAGGFPGSQ